MIPKKIHYCWFGPAPLPKLVKRCMQTWREVMPDYEICLWNEENSPMDHPFVKQAYVAKKYAFVADYVRFWVLYNYGGIYLDTDMYVVKRFDDLLDNMFFAGYEDSQMDVISCGIIGTMQKSDVLKDVLAYYDCVDFNLDDLAPFIVPRIMTPIVAGRNCVKIYPYDYFYPFPFAERKKRNFLDYKTKNTYAIHLWDISWYPWYKKIVRDFVIIVKKILKKK